MKTIKTLLFGTPQECESTGQILQSTLVGHCLEYRHVNDMEEFEAALVEWEPSLTVVVADGAAGLESVFRSRNRRPCVPVFWFSDDREFGMQSYRLECAYFSTKPITHDKLSHAIARCEHIGIDYAVN